MLSPNWCHRQEGVGREVFAKGADDIAEIPAIRRFARVSGSAQKAWRGCILMVRKWGGAVSWIDR